MCTNVGVIIIIIFMLVLFYSTLTMPKWGKRHTSTHRRDTRTRGRRRAAGNKWKNWCITFRLLWWWCSFIPFAYLPHPTATTTVGLLLCSAGWWCSRKCRAESLAVYSSSSSVLPARKYIKVFRCSSADRNRIGGGGWRAAVSHNNKNFSSQ